MIQINETIWQEIKSDHERRKIAVARLEELKDQLVAMCEERDKTIEYLRGQIGELQEARERLVNNILTGAPECWDGDAAAEQLCEDYVRSLDANSTDMLGHRNDCTCWE